MVLDFRKKSSQPSPKRIGFGSWPWSQVSWLEVEVKQLAKGVFVGDPLAQAADLGVKPGMVVPWKPERQKVMKFGPWIWQKFCCWSERSVCCGTGLVVLGRHLTGEKR